MRPTPAPLALALSVLAFAAQAQTADNPVTGKALFENTALASGNAGLPSCTSCHGSVEARRSQISGTGDSFADITFDTAMTRFTAALATQPDMRPLRVLTTQQVRDIAALKAVNKVLGTRSADEIRTLLRWHVLTSRASALGQPWRGLDQEFSRQRQNLQAVQPRERDVTNEITVRLFSPLSKLYVESYFPEGTRRDITQMVGHIKDEFEQRLRSNPWLDEPTRAAALNKLAKVDIQFFSVALVDLDTPAPSSGIEVIREYVDASGAPVKSVKIGDEVTAVSYTHLTLPTNREV